MNTAKRHHFNPCLHLKHFAGNEPQGHIWTYDKQSEQVRHSLPEETAFETHFYSVEQEGGTMDTRIEEALARVESKAVPVYEALLGGDIPELDTQPRADFANFLGLMYARTPAMRRMYAEIYGRNLQIKTYATALHPDAFEAHIRKYQKETGIVLTEEQRNELRDDLLNPSRYIMAVPKETTLRVLGVADRLTPFRRSRQSSRTLAL